MSSPSPEVGWECGLQAPLGRKRTNQLQSRAGADPRNNLEANPFSGGASGLEERVQTTANGEEYCREESNGDDIANPRYYKQVISTDDRSQDRYGR